MKRAEFFLKAQMLHEEAAVPGILANDEINPFKRFNGPERDIAQIADGRRYQIKNPARLAHRNKFLLECLAVPLNDILKKALKTPARGCVRKNGEF